MKRGSPTIVELLAFDAVARYGSVTQAALALCVSVSGISKQISGLEKFIGRPLLRKNGRGVTLTSAGREYWMKISPCLRTIESATYAARSEGDTAGVLTIASVPTFLTKWLIPRLTDFRHLYPDVTFSFRKHVETDEYFPSDIDAAIRYGDGGWADVRADYIAGCDFVCIVSPELLHAEAQTLANNDFSRLTLLHHEQTPQAWQQWISLRGLDDTRTLAGPHFAQYSALIQAVLSSYGVGLVPRILVEDELAEERLKTIGEPLSLDQGHYFCFVAEKLDRPVFAAFRDWLLQQGRGLRMPSERISRKSPAHPVRVE